MPRDISCPLGIQWEYGSFIIKCLTPHSAILEMTLLNVKSRSVNRGHISKKPLDVPETETLAIKNWWMKAQLLFI